MNYLDEFLALVTTHLAFLISPGPNFAIVLRNSLIYSRKIGFFTVLGIASATFFHVLYTILGISVLIASSSFLFSAVRFLGAAFLIYSGVKSINIKIKNTVKVNDLEIQKQDDFSHKKAYIQGFLTNALNPTSFVLFLTMFTTVVSPKTPIFIKFLYGGWISLANILWLSFVSYLASQPRLRKQLNDYIILIERVMGCILVLLGISLFFK